MEDAAPQNVFLKISINVSPVLYDDWVQALLQTVALHDHQCGKQLEQQWRDVLMPAIDIIKAAY